jgi:hypothetical protein
VPPKGHLGFLFFRIGLWNLNVSSAMSNEDSARRISWRTGGTGDGLLSCEQKNPVVAKRVARQPVSLPIFCCMRRVAGGRSSVRESACLARMRSPVRGRPSPPASHMARATFCVTRHVVFFSGCSAAWLAHLPWEQDVGSSNLSAPTSFIHDPVV